MAEGQATSAVADCGDSGLGDPATVGRSAGAWSPLARSLQVIGGSLAVVALAVAALQATPRATAAEETAWGEWGCGRMMEVAGERGRGAFDPATGADNRNWAPDPLVEYRHLRLDLDLVDMDRARFEGLATYRIAPIGVPVQGLTLDCAGLDVKWVRWGKGMANAGEEIEFFHDGPKLGIRFAEPLPPREVEVAIRYSGDRPAQGLIFTPSLGSGEGTDAPEVHSQGQAESNHHWFPCHDFPNVRVAVDFYITAPKGLLVSGNGALIERRDSPVGGVTGAAPVGEARELWHWRQAEPIVPYLVAIVAGRFARVPLEAPESGVSMHVWVPPEREGDVERTFGNTDAMMRLYEHVFGQRYPWARYDQLVVRNFGAGGMENVAATTLHPGSLFDEIAGEEEDLDGLVSHELAHQWAGDLVTCRTWAHIWLNEGWATYATALWFEERDGEVGYFDSMVGNFGVAQRDSTNNQLPMVSPIYRNPWETFSRAANPYTKGASVLHMLRERLGEEIFYDGTRRYMAAHAGGLAETDDFRKALEAASGTSLEWFFDQWCLRPGSPNLKATVRYDAESRALTVRVEQTQKIDERTPAFRFDLPIYIETASGARTMPWEIRERVAERRFDLDGPPTMVAIDPRLATLKTLEVDMETKLLTAAAWRGPTQAARRFAIDALASRSEPASLDMLMDVATAVGAPRTSRRRAIEALADFGTPEALAKLIDLFDRGEADPRVRLALVRALQKQPKDDAAERLEKVALHDRSYQCRAAAASILGSIKASDRAEVLLTLTKQPSHQERIRGAAIEALVAIEDLRAIEPALALAARGNFDRARPDAIRALAKLGGMAESADRDRIIQALLPMLDDPERRSRDAAGEALATLRATEATDRLQAIASSDRDPGRRERAERWLRAIRGEEPAQTP
ncbi:MAG: HEAT repeat domain-containing protein [Phycisphaeraceae bacterium]|nr:HEAT repeat domain-containing protein [Phycisphaeraceae bacterium]